MDPRFEAIHAFRRQAIGLEQRPPRRALRALFVGCSECAAASALLASLDPDQTLLNHGGVVVTSGRLDAAASATLAYAIGVRDARHVVLVGHSLCSYPQWSGSAAHVGRAGSRAHLAGQARAVKSLLAPKVALHALWIDEDDGDLFELVDPDAPRFDLMSDLDLSRLLARLAE